MNGVAVIREGEGPEILLVHGGASPSTTWAPLAPLKARWTLAFLHRRGYPPSPQPPDGRQDFDVDAADLAPGATEVDDGPLPRRGCHRSSSRARRRLPGFGKRLEQFLLSGG